MKVGAGAGIAKGCCVGAGLWRCKSSLLFRRPPNPLSCTRDKIRQTDGKARLSSEDAFNFHKDDFVS